MVNIVNAVNLKQACIPLIICLLTDDTPYFFRFTLTFPFPLLATQNHGLMVGREGERAGDAMQLVAKRF